MNKVILVGRLGQEPELKFGTTGVPICNFNVATSESFKNSSGEKVTKTEWHKVVVFGPFAEVCQMNLQKGHQVLIEGKLETRSWEDSNKNKRSSTNIVASKVEFLSGRTMKESKSDKTQMNFDYDTGEVLGGTSFAPDDIEF